LGRFLVFLPGAAFRGGLALTGRAGVRVAGTWSTAAATWQPYVRFHLLRTTGADDATTFGDLTPIASSARQTLGQADAGVAVTFLSGGSVYASVSYTENLAGERQRVLAGRVGLRWSW
jgi:outer membrane autotransporter protein